jgi:hypothetical protein
MPPRGTTTAPPTAAGTGANTSAPPSQAESAPDTDQSAVIAGWPADRQSSFQAWPSETQTYFWSLPEERQNVFWALSDSDKLKLSQMPEPQRESVWSQIEAQAGATPR